VPVVDQQACDAHELSVVALLLVEPIELLPLPKDPEAHHVQRLEIVPVFVNVGRKDQKDSLSPAEEEDSGEDRKDQDTRSHPIESVYVHAHGREEFKMRQELEHSEGVKDGRHTQEEHLQLAELGSCLKGVELRL
jgi:hypothetical protein